MGLFTDLVDSFRSEETADNVSPALPYNHAHAHVDVSTDRVDKVDYDSDKSVAAAPVEKPAVTMTADGAAVLTTDESGLQRKLSGRHMQMIAFGGSIGTGLFVGSGGALSTGGPGSLILGFALMGVLVYSVVMALGELASTFPVSGSFAAYTIRFIDPSWGTAVGYNYMLQWIIVLPLELTAASIVIQYWDPNENVPKGIWVAMFLIILTIINLFGVKGYGEVEVMASMVKIIAVLGFMILAIVIDVGGTPANRYFGAHTWHDPGAFANGFKGFCSIFVTAAFAFAGTELVGLAAAETSNPRKEVPKAAKAVVWRILFFYLISLFLIGLLVRYDDPRLNGKSSYDARASPFVIAIVNGGISVLPSIFNAVILVSVTSVGNSAVYASSRTLTGLAQSRLAPSFFAFIDRKGRPTRSVGVALAFGFLAFLIYSASKSVVFNWMLAISGLSSIFTWGSICWAHLRFRSAWKAQGHTVEEIPWSSPAGVAGSYFGVGFTILVLIAQFYIAVFPIGYASLSNKDRVNDFFLAYLAAPIVIAGFVAHKLYSRTRWRLIPLEDIDVTTGRRSPVPVNVLRREREEAAAKPFLTRVWAALT